MAWDKDRPYAPFSTRDGWGIKSGDMLSYSYETPDEDDIDEIYANGELQIGMDVFTPFRDVEMTLKLIEFEQHRATGVFRWSDGELSYPMFAAHFNELLSDGKLSVEIHGKWSAEKRGANYGVKLVEVLR